MGRLKSPFPFIYLEGATPIHDCSGLTPLFVQNMADPNRVEAENISYAQNKYLRGSKKDIALWFRFYELQEIHRSMFGNVWSWAGKIRKTITSIGVEPAFIPLKLGELCEEVKSWSVEPIELTFIEKSARIYHRLVKIHPFENGNGRFSRLIGDRSLLCWKCPFPIWPENLNSDGGIRKLYIEALKDADNGDYTPLISLMKRFGASDPSVSSFLHDPFYQSYLQDRRGLAKIKALLRNEGDPNSTTKNGHHCLQLLIKAKLDSKKKIALLKLLVEKGANINQKDKTNLSPFQTAIMYKENEVGLFLKSNGAEIE